MDLPGGRGPPDISSGTATHKKVKILVQCTNRQRTGETQFAANTGGLRKGSLTFWKLQPPNLIPSLLALRAGTRKTLAYSLLARIAAQIATPPGSSGKAGRFEQGNVAGRWA